MEQRQGERGNEKKEGVKWISVGHHVDVVGCQEAWRGMGCDGSW